MEPSPKYTITPPNHMKFCTNFPGLRLTGSPCSVTLPQLQYGHNSQIQLLTPASEAGLPVIKERVTLSSVSYISPSLKTQSLRELQGHALTGTTSPETRPTVWGMSLMRIQRQNVPVGTRGTWSQKHTPRYQQKERRNLRLCTGTW